MKRPILFLFLFLADRICVQSYITFKEFGEYLPVLKGLIDSVTLQSLHPDTGLNISQLLEKYNYPLESHEVETEDGFFLTLHRIPRGRNEISTVDTSKPAVLLVHCLACSSANWINLGPDNALGLLLADAGYDVWLINTRGTQYSMKHRTLNTSDPAFWDFSFHEKGFYDLPASLDYVINSAGVDKVTLIGFSEGTTDSLVLGAARPEYNDKLNLMVLFGPSAYMDGVRSPAGLLAVQFMDSIQLIFETLNIYGIPYSSVFSSISETLCSENSPIQQLCIDIIGLICGFDEAQLDKTYLTVLLSNMPTGFSVKELIHYGQEIKSGFFRQYDYGSDEDNFQHYGSNEPPSYDPTKITAPVAAYYGKNDYCAGVEDVEKLTDQLPNKADTYLVDYENFNHIDFIWAKDVKSLVYDRVIPVIQKYNPVNN